jgi:hypothetical protein
MPSVTPEKSPSPAIRPKKLRCPTAQLIMLAEIALGTLLTFSSDWTLAAPPDNTPPPWSEPIDGLQFRARTPRTVFQAWEQPTFILDVRNTNADSLTPDLLKKVFVGDAPDNSDLVFWLERQHQPWSNSERWRNPPLGMDLQQLAGLKPGETRALNVSVTATTNEKIWSPDPYDLIAGHYAIGFGSPQADQAGATANDITLTILPRGVHDQAELATFLKPYSPGGQPINAGFVPNKTTLVLGEPIIATFIVDNPGDKPFTFEFAGDLAGVTEGDVGLPAFQFAVIGPDGKPIAGPAGSGGFEGAVNAWTVRPHEQVAATLDLMKHRAVATPGKYEVSYTFDLTLNAYDEPKGNFNVPVLAKYDLTILPRNPANIQRVLDEYFTEANQTRGLELRRLIDTISSFGQVSAIAQLTAMGTTGDPEHRAAAATGLGKIADPVACAALLRINPDSSTDVRTAAIAALSAFSTDEAVAAVVRALHDPNPSIRKTAAASLGQIKTDAAITALIDRLPKSDPELGAAVLRAMGQSQSPKVFPIIQKALVDKNGEIRHGALDAIANFPPDRAASVLRSLAATEPDLDFREAIVGQLAETLHQPIEMDWLVPVIESRKQADSIGDASRLMRLYGGDQAAPALLSCLDFSNPAVRNYYNMVLVEDQLPCEGSLAIPWIADLNRDGSAEETAQNSRTLRILKKWVEYYRLHPVREAPLPWTLSMDEEEKTWGAPVDGLSIRAHVRRSIWPAGLPQVIAIEGRQVPEGNSVTFATRPQVLELEINQQWYTLPSNTDLSVSGEWNAYHGGALHDLQLDGRWRRKSDGQALDLEPGTYTVRVGISQISPEKRKGIAISLPVKFEVIPTE